MKSHRAGDQAKGDGDRHNDEYQYQQERSDLKYNIIRLPNQWYYRDLEEELLSLDLDVQFINHHTCVGVGSGSSASDFNDYVAVAPACFTIIWIYGSLRAGKQLNTKHLGFVHDTSSSGPDIIAQSLLGRILGYRKSKDHVRCYTDLAAAKLMLEWIHSAYDVLKIPQGSKGIVGGYSEHLAHQEWALHVPILVTMTQSMRVHYRRLKQKHGNRYPYKTDLFIDLALSATEQRADIIRIFENYQPGQCGGLMILTEDNKPQSFRDHWSHNYRAHLLGTFSHCCNADRPGKYYYVYVNLHIGSPEYGLALVTYKEHVSRGGDAQRAAVVVKSKSRFSM